MSKTEEYINHGLARMDPDKKKLPEGWEWKKLSDLFTIRPQKKQAKEKLNDNDEISFVPMECLNVHDRNLTLNQTRALADVYGGYTYFEDNDVLLAKITPCFENGKVGIARNLKNGIGFGSSEFIVFRSQGEVIPEYLYYYLSQESFRQEGKAMMAGAVGHKRVSKDFINEYQLPFPESIQEQKHIVAILDEAFAAIDKAKANAEKNMANAKELFESYLNGIFRDIFQANEKKTIYDVATVLGGYSFKSTEFKKEGKYQVIRMGNVRPGIIRENVNPVFINEIDENVRKRALLIPNDIIITQTGTKKKRDYGFTVLIDKHNYLLNQRIASIRFSEMYLPKFFLYFSWTNLFKDQYFTNETGTVGQGNVGISAITYARIPDVSVKDQKLVVDQVENLRIASQKLESIYKDKKENLDELKKSILKKAFEGEL